MNSGVIIVKELSGANFLKPVHTFLTLNRSTVNGKIFITPLINWSASRILTSPWVKNKHKFLYRHIEYNGNT